MIVRIKKLDPNAVIPSKAHVNDAGLDLFATSVRMEQHEGTYIEYGTGIAIDIPSGHAGFLFPRSSISKVQLSLCNSVGCVDAGFLGEIKLRFQAVNGNGLRQSKLAYEVGDRIGQLIILPLPEVTLVEVDELGDSERGDGGFGSSGA